VYIYVTFRVHITARLVDSIVYTFLTKKTKKLAFPDNKATGRLKLRDRELNELYI